MGEVPGAPRPILAGSPEPQDPLDCWACAVLVKAQNLQVAVFNLLMLALVLGTILLPAVTMLGFSFLCHSQFLGSEAPSWAQHLWDPGFTALLVTGLELLLPLLVLALATYCHLGLRFCLTNCPVPYSRAFYRRQLIPQPISKSQSHQSSGLFPHRKRSGFEVLRVKNPVDCPPGLSRT